MDRKCKANSAAGKDIKKEVVDKKEVSTLYPNVNRKELKRLKST